MAMYHTEIYGFKSLDLDAITDELSRVLARTPRLSRSDSRGSDVSAYGYYDKPGGSLKLFKNHSHDGIEPIVNEPDYPEMDSILLIEQKGDYVDYAPKLERMERFEVILLLRRRYDSETREREVLFDLAAEDGRASSE